MLFKLLHLILPLEKDNLQNLLSNYKYVEAFLKEENKNNQNIPKKYIYAKKKFKIFYIMKIN
jgi:hypothetical protein